MDPGMSVRHTKNTAEATRKHDRLGAAVRAGGEQFKRPPAVGLGATPAAFCWLFGVRGPQRRHSVLTQVERGVFPLPPSSITYMPRLWRGARQENSSSCLRPVNPPPDTGRVVANPAGTGSTLARVGPGKRDGPVTAETAAVRVCALSSSVLCTRSQYARGCWRRRARKGAALRSARES